MSAVALATVVAGSHYWPCKPGEVEFKPPETASKGAKLMYALTKEAFGGIPLHCVSPHLLSSIDDMNHFIFKGVKRKGQSMLIGSREALSNKNVQSIIDPKKSTSFQTGCHVKLGTTGTAAGQTSVPYVVISGLSRSEMPLEETPDGLIVMEVEGHCIGGSVYPSNCGTGFIMFTRSDSTNTVHVQCFLHQLEKAQLNFLDDVWMSEFDCVASASDDAIPNSLHSVQWFDGVQDQMEVSIISLKKFKEKKSTANKQNAAQTGSEQGEDLSLKYPIICRESKMTSTFVEDELMKPKLQRILESKLKELWKLNKLILNKVSCDAIVNCWTGPKSTL